MNQQSSYQYVVHPSTLVSLCQNNWPDVFAELNVEHQLDQQTGQFWLKHACHICQSAWMLMDPAGGMLRCCHKPDGKMPCGGMIHIADVLVGVTGHDLQSIILAASKLLDEGTDPPVQPALQPPVIPEVAQPIPQGPPPGFEYPQPGIYGPPIPEPQIDVQPIPQAPPPQPGVNPPVWQPHQTTIDAEIAAKFGNFQDDVGDRYEVQWLWKGYLPVSVFSLFQGDPDAGKSAVYQDLCARVTTGRPMPMCDESQEPSNVIILSSEEAKERYIKPRLRAAGADFKRIKFPKADAFSIPRNLADLEQGIHYFNARLVVFDTFVSFLDGTVNFDSYQSLHGCISALNSLGERTGCTFIGIRHLNKMEGLSAMNRGSGSVAGSAAARAGLHFGTDPDDPEYQVAVPFKGNNAKPGDKLAIRYKIISDEQYPDFPKIEWVGFSYATPDDLVAKQEDGKKLRRAKTVLLEMLSHGSQFRETIKARMHDEGIGWSTVKKAKKALNIQHEQGDENQNFQFYWFLPNI